jgi:hypothetical protein
MVRKLSIILVVIIIMAIVISGFIYTFTRPPEDSAAQTMALKGYEIGLGWIDSEGYDPYYYPNESSGVSWDYWLHNESGTINIRLSLTVFNSTEACNAVFENENATFYAGYSNKDWCNYSIVPIGDKAIYLDAAAYYWGVGYSENNSPECMFSRGYVLCILWCPPVDNIFAWEKDVILNIANLQVQKIDQYLAQHPGAS